ncbi:MAG: ABC transporter permease [Nitriliruptorales bacterium]
MATPVPLRVLESHARVYRRTWRGSAISAFLNPILYLAALGMGLGTLVDRGDTAALALPYVEWLAPALLVASTMQTGFNESAWPVMAGLKWRETYHAALATPVGVRDLVLGHIGWVTIRVTMTGLVFAIVAVGFGAMRPVAVPLAVAIGTLTGIAFAAPITAYTAGLDRDYHLTSLMRFGIVPMFLFSGTFFPIERLPGWLEPVAFFTPLWHGVEIARAVGLDEPTRLPILVNVAVLAVLAVAGTAAAIPLFARRLVP